MILRSKPWLALILIFCLGMITGGCLTYGLMPLLSHAPQFRQMGNHWMTHLTERLKLTSDQQAKIQPILTDAESQLQAVHREELEHIGKIIEAANAQIEPLLTPDQTEEFKKMESERKKMLARRMLEGYHGPRDDDSSAPPPPAHP